MNAQPEHKPVRVACDAMCGGVARWLRVFGVDATFTADIEDGQLVRQALTERRIVVSSDHKIFERRAFTSGELAGLPLPVGLKLDEQVRFVAERLNIRPGVPRCTLCNGELTAVDRATVADVVPARSLIWAKDFFRCRACGHVFWEGTHWRRIRTVRAEAAAAFRPPCPGYAVKLWRAGTPAPLSKWGRPLCLPFAKIQRDTPCPDDST